MPSQVPRRSKVFAVTKNNSTMITTVEDLTKQLFHSGLLDMSRGDHIKLSATRLVG